MGSCEDKDEICEKRLALLMEWPQLLFLLLFLLLLLLILLLFVQRHSMRS
jgi:hypothetical protein